MCVKAAMAAVSVDAVDRKGVMVEFSCLVAHALRFAQSAANLLLRKMRSASFCVPLNFF